MKHPAPNAAIVEEVVARDHVGAMPHGRSTLSTAEIAAIMRALGEPRRYDIVRQLAAADAPVPCCALVQAGQVSASTLSHHLQQLEGAGLIEVRRNGRFAMLCFERDRYAAFLRQLGADAGSATGERISANPPP